MIFEHAALQALVTDIFEAAGCHSEEAQCVVIHLVEANLVGHDSHGVIRISSYVDWLRDGKVFANKSMQVVSDNGAIAVVDGQFGLGQTICEQAIELGIDKARTHGVSVIALRNSGHLGRVGDWAIQAADAGMISLHFVNTSGAGMLVAPFGGIDRRLSANPLAAGVPTSGAPLILDMSACTIAEGKIRVALNKGERVADGCIIDSAGRPTNDPATFYSEPGSILPIAGHKGYALSMIIEMLAGALTGGSCTNVENNWRVANGMLSIIIDRSRFGPAEEFFPEVSRFIEFVKSSRTVEADGTILVPGEIELRTKAQRLKHGIELDETTWRQLHETCDRLGVTHGFAKPANRNSSSAAGIVIPGSDAAPTHRG